MVNLPSRSVVAVATTARCGVSTSTLAPTSTAPERSLAVPTMSASSSNASGIAAAISQNTGAQAQFDTSLRIICTSRRRV